MKYDIFLADPPWRYDAKMLGNRAIENQYKTMMPEQVAAIPVAQMGHDASALFLWATAPKLEQALFVMGSWGFGYVTHAIWDKEIIGMGYWFRGQHELLLVGRRRKTPATPVPHRRSSIFTERRTTHSTKPQCVYEWIEAAFPAASKLEMFARSQRPGWSVWGDEIENDAAIAAQVIA